VEVAGLVRPCGRADDECRLRPGALQAPGAQPGDQQHPPKACPYACVYCQVGPTRASGIVPRSSYEPSAVAREVTETVERLRNQGERIDYLAFVPDEEPTLDAGLGREIDLLRPPASPSR